MAERRRKGPAQIVTSGRLLALLDRFYDMDVDDLTWMHGVAEAIEPLVDCGAGVFASAIPSVPGYTMSVANRGYDGEAAWGRVGDLLPRSIVTRLVRQMPISNADKSPAPDIRRLGPIVHGIMGVHSCSGITASRADGFFAISIPAPTRGVVFWPEHDRPLWDRIVAHLSAAFRLRRDRDQRPRLVFDARGRLLHAERDVVADPTLPTLRQAAGAVAQARNRRGSPAKVLAAWRALYQGDWSIVESVQRDGRRLLLARPNAPLALAEQGAPAPRPRQEPAPSPARPSLSPAERRVLEALASGSSNKAIAYQLGLADSTVSTLLARAARKLGCRNRIELTVAARAARGDDAPLGREP
ncbi:MAG: LuxR C-terminal-related transcriptional regulator [Kofleriaceae bacterium]